MYRQLIIRQQLRAAVPSVRTFHYTAVNNSIIETTKSVLDKANKATGKVLADGMEAAEKVAPTASTVKDAAEKAHKKTGEVLADGMEEVEKHAPNAKSSGEVHDAKKKVQKNAEGYLNLQDKGSKAESEQNRPDDAV